MTEKPFYNSALVDNYIQLLKAEYSHINIDDLLSGATIEPWELDPGNWFTQSQVNRFYQLLLEKTGNKNIAREAGRFSVANRAGNIMRQSALSLLSPSNLYDILGQISKKYTKAIRVHSKKLSSSSHEIVTEWLDDVRPEKYQCDNMIGYLEAVHLVFRSSLPDIEHPECFFENGGKCKYIISWKKTVSERIVRIRNIASAICIPALFILFFMGFDYLLEGSITFLLVFLLMTLASMGYEKKELLSIVRKQDFKPHDVLDSHNRYHRSTNLLKDISVALSKNKNVSDFMTSVGNIYHALGYRSGLIILVDYRKNEPAYADVYHYRDNFNEYLSDLKNKRALFVNSDEGLKNPSVKTHKQLIDIFPEGISKLLFDIGFNSVVYLPMVFEKTLLGFIFIKNEKNGINASDLYLLHSIASQSALSITNIIFNESLMASEQLKKDFVTVASHEMLTPVQIITFAIHDIKTRIQKLGLYKSDLADSMNILDQSVRKLGSISKNILDFKKLEADLSLNPININQIINTLEQESQYVITSFGHRIHFDVDNQIEQILCNENTFIQLLSNLIENAAKYTPDYGKIKVSFELNPAELMISIEDNGIGIHEEFHELVFMKFYQVNKDQTGSGMGLSYCQEVAKKHEGYITLESPLFPEEEFRRGTRFVIHLPKDKAIADYNGKG